DRVRMCKRVAQIIVATDDERIVEALRPFETDARITSASHQSGTDRIWEVVQNFEPGSIIVNVQGDEPEIEPEIVDKLIKNVQEADQRELMVTVATSFPAGADPDDPNLVKVVMGIDNRALYFSRSRIPYVRDKDST